MDFVLERYIKNKYIGDNTAISTIGDGTLSGAVSKLNNDLTAQDNNNFRFRVEEGKYGYLDGDDTFVPFSNLMGSTFVQLPKSEYSTSGFNSVVSTHFNDENYDDLFLVNFVFRSSDSGNISLQSITGGGEATTVFVQNGTTKTILILYKRDNTKPVGNSVTIKFSVGGSIQECYTLISNIKS